jgi:hypothetical protein
MPLGRCRLCLNKDVQLRRSHLVPAGLYKIVRDDRFSVSHPVHVATDATMLSSRQVADLLLCDNCERRFEQGGETWLIPRCWQDTSTFPIRDLLVAAQPIPTVDSGVAMYESASIGAIDTGRIAYFAASVFWRAGVHEWSIHQHRLPRLRFGKYETELQQFLLNGIFPPAAALLVFVGSGMEEIRNANIVFPYSSGQQPGWHRYTLVIPGITFWLFLGNRIPPAIRRACCLRSDTRLLLSSDEVDKANVQMNIGLFARSRAVGIAAQSPPVEIVGTPSPWPLKETMKFVPRDPTLVRILHGRPKT